MNVRAGEAALVLERIAGTIVEIARREDLVLRRLGKGIFFMPELAFAYMVGREIALHAGDVFGTTDIRWRREIELVKEAGITDLFFETGRNEGIAIEFKVRGRSDEYRADIDKLRTLRAARPGCKAVFCALVDVFCDTLEKDPRVAGLGGDAGLRRLPHERPFEFFTTVDDAYQKPVCCMVAVWEVSGSGSQGD